jgi:hypothetical protein
LWLGWWQDNNTWRQATNLSEELYSVYKYFNSDEYLNDPIIYDGIAKTSKKTGTKSKPFVHYFNTTGILQHNDNGPGYHPTDVGHIKIASHLIQYITMKFDWPLYVTGPE